MSKTLNYAASLLPDMHKSFVLSLNDKQKEAVTELRFRLGRPFAVKFNDSGIFSQSTVTQNDINYTMALLSDHSLNSVRDKLIRGFIPLKYGCRAGVAGETVIKNGSIDFITSISGINIRIAREKIGSADKIIHEIYSSRGINSTLIVSPPGMGKTTLLRDIARMIGNNVNTVIIDERSEIASCKNGTPTFDIGKMTDVIDQCPKDLGVMMALRSLSPKVIIVDEIGSASDSEALAEAYRSGVAFIATMHSGSIEDGAKRTAVRALFEGGIIKRAILLGNSKGIGTIERIEHFD